MNGFFVLVKHWKRIVESSFLSHCDRVAVNAESRENAGDDRPDSVGLVACFDGLASVVGFGAESLAELGDCSDELFVLLGCVAAPIALSDVGTDSVEQLGIIDVPDVNLSGCVAHLDLR